MECARLAAALASRELAPGGLHRTPKAPEYVKLGHNGLKNLSRAGKQACRSKAGDPPLAAASRAHSQTVPRLKTKCVTAASTSYRSGASGLNH